MDSLFTPHKSAMLNQMKTPSQLYQKKREVFDMYLLEYLKISEKEDRRAPSAKVDRQTGWGWILTNTNLLLFNPTTGAKQNLQLPRKYRIDDANLITLFPHDGSISLVACTTNAIMCQNITKANSLPTFTRLRFLEQNEVVASMTAAHKGSASNYLLIGTSLGKVIYAKLKYKYERAAEEYEVVTEQLHKNPNMIQYISSIIKWRASAEDTSITRLQGRIVYPRLREKMYEAYSLSNNCLDKWGYNITINNAPNSHIWSVNVRNAILQHENKTDRDQNLHFDILDFHVDYEANNDLFVGYFLVNSVRRVDQNNARQWFKIFTVTLESATGNQVGIEDQVLTELKTREPFTNLSIHELVFGPSEVTSAGNTIRKGCVFLSQKSPLLSQCIEFELRGGVQFDEFDLLLLGTGTLCLQETGEVATAVVTTKDIRYGKSLAAATGDGGESTTSGAGITTTKNETSGLLVDKFGEVQESIKDRESNLDIDSTFDLANPDTKARILPIKKKIMAIFGLYRSQNRVEAQREFHELMSQCSTREVLLSIDSISCDITDDSGNNPRMLLTHDKTEGGVTVSAGAVFGTDQATHDQRSGGTIIYQLLEKFKRHEALWKFLEFIHIWRLDGSKEVRNKIIENIEKLQVAIKIREIQNRLITDGQLTMKEESRQLCLDALNQVIRNRLTEERILQKDLDDEGIAAVDKFFIRVSQIEKFLVALSELISTEHKRLTTSQQAILIELSNEIWISSYDCFRAFRVKLTNENIARTSNWASDDKQLECMKEIQFRLTTDILVEKDAQAHYDVLSEQMIKLGHTLMEQLQFDDKLSPPKLRNRMLFEYRSDIIGNFRKINSDTALDFAIEYKDFEHFISICYERRDWSFLRQYMIKWQRYNFATVVFKWMNDKQKYVLKNNLHTEWQGSIILKEFEQFQTELTAFLDAHPNLQWLNKLKQEHYDESNDILYPVAVDQSAVRFRQNLLALGVISAQITSDPKGDDFMRQFEVGETYIKHSQNDKISKQLIDVLKTVLQNKRAEVDARLKDACEIYLSASERPDTFFQSSATGDFPQELGVLATEIFNFTVESDVSTLDKIAKLKIEGKGSDPQFVELAKSTKLLVLASVMQGCSSFFSGVDINSLAAVEIDKSRAVAIKTVVQIASNLAAGNAPTGERSRAFLNSNDDNDEAREREMRY